MLSVPNDEDDNENGDIGFMPIKSNDDDEPVRFKATNHDKMSVILSRFSTID